MEPKYKQNEKSRKATFILDKLKKEVYEINPMQLLYYMSEIVKLGESAIGPLCNELRNDDDWQIRAIAAKGLRDIGSKLAVPALILGLKDKDERVRQPVIGALGKIGEPSSLEYIRVLLDDKDDNVREEAKKAIERMLTNK